MEPTKINFTETEEANMLGLHATPQQDEMLKNIISLRTTLFLMTGEEREDSVYVFQILFLQLVELLFIHIIQSALEL